MSLKFPSVGRLFEAETGIELISGPYGPYTKLQDEDEIALALKWQEDREGLVFLFDHLDSSIALDFNFAAREKYTELGEAEHRAKTTRESAAIKKLVDACADAINSISHYEDCAYICAVPPSPDKDFDLPTELAKRLAEKCGKVDISPKVRFTRSKKSIKALSLKDKWAALEEGKMAVGISLRRKKVILIDDKYQSGTTAQYAGSKLYEAGAEEVHGLFCVKTWRDTDNQ